MNLAKLPVASGLSATVPVLLTKPLFPARFRVLSGVTIAPECTMLGPETGQTGEISNARRHPQRRPREARTGSAIARRRHPHDAQRRDRQGDGGGRVRLAVS